MQDSAMIIALWAAIVGCYAMCIGFIKWVVSKSNGHDHLVTKEVCEVRTESFKESHDQLREDLKDLRSDVNDGFKDLKKVFLEGCNG